MNTATISIHAATDTTNNRLAFESPESTPYNFAIVKEDPTETPSGFRFERDIVQFQQSDGRQRAGARLAIVKRILSAESADEYIHTTISTLISSGRPGRLDDAVDILSMCGKLLPPFVYESLSQQTISECDDDYWYVLIRGIGKSGLPSARMLIELLWSKSPEAAVEALGDVGDPKALERLEETATNDESKFVRELAADVLEECSE